DADRLRLDLDEFGEWILQAPRDGDGTGKVVATSTVYPFQTRNDVRGAQVEIASLIRKHNVELISIGNGTGSRENEKLVADMLAELPAPKPTKVIVS
ncbi:hypothetical protein, partial [Rhizobium leguminosarum]|uniref:hypothetical protein n=1 Tax=Rhizobium leguminosarum TaxID=384 RepID=UPI003F94CFA4